MKTKKGFRLRQLGNENILTPEGIETVDFHRMISMNSSAAFLWEKVDGKEFTPETLASLLVEKYGIDEEVALKDSKAIADDWVKIGIAEG